ncbi:MAG TPA: hypothetical protein VI670_08065 [Thermoanaerobaculia bacterium]|jgi:hypothetical protein
MARIRDLGINAIPGTMRPLEIGPGAAYEIQAPATPYLVPQMACDRCPCNEPSNQIPTSDVCDDATNCPTPSIVEPPPGYDASGFTLESVAELKRQLRTRLTELEN